MDLLKKLTPYDPQQGHSGDIEAHMARMKEDMIRARREVSAERCERLETERKHADQQDEDLSLFIRAAVVAGAINQPVEQATAPVKSAEKPNLAIGQVKFRRLVKRGEAEDGAARQELKQLLRRHRGIWQELAVMVKTIQANLLDKVIGRGNELRESASRLLEDGRSQLRRYPGNAIEQLAVERLLLVQAQVWALELVYSGATHLSDEEAAAVARAKESAAKRQRSALDSLATLQKALSEAKPKKRWKRLVIRRTSKMA